jgi:hypothetical protein
MRPTLVHGIILLFLAMAAAAFSKPSGNAHPKSGSAARPDSSIAVPDKKPARAKPEKPAAPLAKPESGDEVESEDTQEDEETASDCDDCVLAWHGQVIVLPGLARAGSAAVSALPYPA